MSELEQRLLAAGAELDWPPTPELRFPAERPRARRRWLVPVVVAALVAALGIALAVPGARSAILHAFHLEGVTIERVDVLPPARERPLGAGLGTRVTAEQAEQVLGRAFALPTLAGQPTLRLSAGVVSTLLADPEPILLSEFRNDLGDVILKKLVGGSTGVTAVEVAGGPGFWIAGTEHVYVAPQAPPRLAGHVLAWTANGIAYRLEGRHLTEAHALRLARELSGT